MEEDDDVTLVGSPPGTCCPNSPTFGPMPNSLDIPSGSPTPSSSPSSYIKPALKKPVERDPFKDLLEMMLIDANVQKIRRRTTSHPIEPKQKKSLRFSRNLEQVHYTPTHYTIQPAPPHTRRRMSNPFFTKMEEDGVAEGYEQMLARARESKHSGKINIPFAKDGSWIGGNSLDDEDDEFVMPPQLVKSPPRNISRGMPQRRSVAMPAAYTVASARKFVSPPAPVIGAPRNAIEVKHVTNRRVDHETRDSGVVERCVNIASNVKDVVSWCGSMLWNSTVF
ncbi:11483_t:CDS:1 [Acaulospora colombiana]|uniref:11483_t:CDS:1 n=1 Tax=Acaulospora colombiana TaxID=27376 RepID=A0ACA9LMK1_9GLOM|nr:11483_t:CDS:1 [Acaulospora colombiana]